MDYSSICMDPVRANKYSSRMSYVMEHNREVRKDIDEMTQRELEQNWENEKGQLVLMTPEGKLKFVDQDGILWGLMARLVDEGVDLKRWVPSKTDDADTVSQHQMERFIQEVLAAMDNADHQVRERAVWTLYAITRSGICDPAWLPKLLGLLDDENEEVRLASLRTIKNLAEEDVYVHYASCPPILTKLLKDDSDGIREDAACIIETLARRDIIDPCCLPGMVALLGDEMESIRMSAVWGVKEMAQRGVFEARCLPQLIELLFDRNDEIKRGAVEALGVMAANDSYDLGCLPPLTRMLEESTDNDSMNNAIIAALGTLAVKGHGEQACLPMLIGLLNREMCRNNCILAIAYYAKQGISDPSSLPVIVASLHDQRPDVRIAALRAVGFLSENGIYDPSSLKKAIDLLDDEEDVKTEAIGTIAKVARRGVVDSSCSPKVRGLLEDPNNEVRESAREVLAALG